MPCLSQNATIVWGKEQCPHSKPACSRILKQYHSTIKSNCYVDYLRSVQKKYLFDFTPRGGGSPVATKTDHLHWHVHMYYWYYCNSKGNHLGSTFGEGHGGLGRTRRKLGGSWHILSTHVASRSYRMFLCNTSPCTDSGIGGAWGWTFSIWRARDLMHGNIYWNLDDQDQEHWPDIS